MRPLPPFDVHRPQTMEEALSLVSEDDLPVLGGTELLLAIRQRLLRPRALVDLGRIPGSKAINIGENEVSIGYAVTHRELSREPPLTKLMPILGEVLRKVGNPRVQAAGTLAGNLCFAEPRSDVIPLLIALEASVTLRSSTGQRSMSTEDFITGPYSTERSAMEILTELTIPIRPSRKVAYVKYQPMERPTIGVAGVRDGRRTRIVVGAAGLIPLIVESDEAPIDPGRVAELVDPMPDLTGSADYKRAMTAVFTRRVLTKLSEVA